MRYESLHQLRRFAPLRDIYRALFGEEGVNADTS